MPADVSKSSGPSGDTGHSGHNGNTTNSDQLCPPKRLQHNDFSQSDTADTADTVVVNGGECQNSYGAPGGGASVNHFALHPAAVILVLAYFRKVKASDDKRVSAILNLETMPPGEQVKFWHVSCLDVGLKPWEVLTLKAPSSGLDCTMCRHLTTRHVAVDDGRRKFHWACRHGYQILETGRATERIWIAPPECSSYERWIPSSKPLAPVTYLSDRIA